LKGWTKDKTFGIEGRIMFCKFSNEKSQTKRLFLAGLIVACLCSLGIIDLSMQDMP